jgi:NADH-quinone oxidoreductase subunit N
MFDINLALQIAAPEALLAIGSMILLMLGAYGGEKLGRVVSLLAVALLIGAAGVAANAPLGMVFNGAFVSDPMSVYAKVAIYLASALAVVLGDGWTRRNGIARFEYPVLIVLAAVGMGMMASAGDLMSLYVGVELQSLALYVLAAFHRDDGRASEAGLKYFVLGALSSGLLLYGSSLIYGFTGSMRFDEIAAVAAGGAETGLIFGLVFLICGLAFKVSAAPFHMWTPDVYEGAPTPVVAFFATAPKFAAMVLFARALSEGFGGAHDQWAQVLVIISLISFAVGAFGGLAQRDIPRLLAYSSIANIGYALLAITAGTQAGLQALLLFMTFYMIDTLGFFALLMALSRGGRPIRRIADLAGLRKDKPVTTIAITVLSLSVLGMPPFAGFWGKFYVFGAALQAGYWIVAALGLVASVVAAFYYLRIIKVMWFDAPPEGEGTVDPSPRDAQWIGWAAAAFSFPLVLIALTWLEPLARNAATSFGAG